MKITKSNEKLVEKKKVYAKDNGIRTICVTDHYWEDEVAGASDWYKMQGFNHICQTSELSGCEDVRFLFGCETDINKENVVGISKDAFKHFDFVIIPTTHLHMKGFTISDEDAQNIEKRAEIWVRKLDAVLNMDIPFYNVGIAHPVCKLIVPERKDYISVLKMIDENEITKKAMAAAVLNAVQEFCKQEPEFAQAVVQGGSFSECMKKVAAGVGSSISDLEAYKKAVQFYFPGAVVNMQLTIDLVGAAADANELSGVSEQLAALDAEPVAEQSKVLTLDLSSFF